MRAIETLRDLGFLLLRVCLGALMFLGHGVAKIGAIGSDAAAQFPDPLGVGHKWSQLLATTNEGLCSLLLIVGLFSRAAAAGLAFTMCVAAFVVQKDASWFPALVNTTDHGALMTSSRELALLYATGFATLVFTGPGRFALDRIVWARLRARFGK